MSQSKAHIRATTKYESKAYDKILIRIRKDGDLTRERIAEAAAKEGASLNGFIVAAIREKMDRAREN